MEQSQTALKLYMGDIGRHKLLTKDEEFEIFDRLRRGDESARNEIVCCNLRLVVRLAQRFRNKGLSVEDLIQEGNIGLLEVIDRFDHTLGFRFSTYAAFWIRQAIQVAVRRHGSMIRLPVRKARMLGKMNEVTQEYQSTRGRMPRRGEMAAAMELTEPQLEELLAMSRTTLSLDASMDDDGYNLLEMVPDKQAQSASDRTMEKEMRDRVQGALKHLSERETTVVRLRFGLGRQSPRSLRNISASMGLSQEGVRRVEQRALAKLGRPQMRSELAGLL